MTDASSSTFTYVPHPSPTSPANRDALVENPSFGRVFSDHMATIRYIEGLGWHDPRIEPRAPIQMDPACAVLHYAQEIFEGLKAYRTDDGQVALFRPEENARRFQRSARRMAMPELPEALFLEAVKQLVRVDRDWVPQGAGTLYLRPFMFASEIFLGGKPSLEYLFIVIAAPVGSYFKSDAVSVWVSDAYTRAAPGGTGAAKCGGNYAGGFVAQAESVAQGCDQVVFLDAVERRWIEELGGMNIFFLLEDKQIMTPPINGTILDGVTRRSIIDLARDMGLEVREEAYAIDQWRDDAASGRLLETFACGTAAMVTAIGFVRRPEGEFQIGDGREGVTTARLRTTLSGIQRRRMPDPRGWSYLVT